MCAVRDDGELTRLTGLSSATLCILSPLLFDITTGGCCRLRPGKAKAKDNKAKALTSLWNTNFELPFYHTQFIVILAARGWIKIQSKMKMEQNKFNTLQQNIKVNRAVMCKF